VTAFALLSLSRRLVFGDLCKNNKRLERGKGKYMNLSTLICLELINASLTLIALLAIRRST
jgi:hypothetical protein